MKLNAGSEEELVPTPELDDVIQSCTNRNIQEPRLVPAPKPEMYLVHSYYVKKIAVRFGSWRLYLPNEYKSKDVRGAFKIPSYKGNLVCKVHRYNELFAVINGMNRQVGLVTHRECDHSIMSLTQAKALGLEDRIEPIDVWNPRVAGIIPETEVLGMIRSVIVKLSDDCTVPLNFYVEEKPSRPDISLGTDMLYGYGFQRKFSRFTGHSWLYYPKCLREPYTGENPLEFNVYVNARAAYRAKTSEENRRRVRVRLTERVRSYVQTPFLKNCRQCLEACFVPCLIPTPNFLQWPIKTIQICTITSMEGRKVTIEEADMPHINADIVLGSKFLGLNGAFVDYRNRCMYIRYYRNPFMFGMKVCKIADRLGCGYNGPFENCVPKSMQIVRRVIQGISLVWLYKIKL